MVTAAASSSNNVPVPVPLVPETVTVPALSAIELSETVKFSVASKILSLFVITVIDFVSPMFPVNVSWASLSV